MTVKAKPSRARTSDKSNTGSKTGSTTSSTSKKRPSTTAARAKAAASKKAPAAKKAAPAKKTASKKPAPKKTAAAKSAPPAVKRELNEHGFMPNTDSATIAAALVEGGADRTDVNSRIIEKIEATTGLTNRNGTQKYVPSMVSGILGRMLATGKYEIHASWQLVPITPTKKVSRRKAPASK